MAVVVACAAWAMAAVGLAASVATPIQVQAADVVWRDAPATMPAGTKVAVLEGDPRQPAFFTLRLKIGPGFRLAPHTHPADERVTVLAGAVHVGFGEVFDDKKGATITAGGFYVNPRDVPHFIWTEQETILQITGIGPWEVRFLPTSSQK